MSIDPKTLEAVAVFASGYGKRCMEGNYDRLMRTDLGARATSLPAGARYGLEAALYALMAFADAKVQTDTAWGRFFKEIAIDAPPEIAKRLINGARHDGEEAFRVSTSDSERAIADVLNGLDDDTLIRIAALARTGADAKTRERMSDALVHDIPIVEDSEGRKPTVDDPILAKARGLNDWLVRARRRLRGGRAEQ